MIVLASIFHIKDFLHSSDFPVELMGMALKTQIQGSTRISLEPWEATKVLPCLMSCGVSLGP
jgi:hypothetical protein